jgi:hypothetical protein
MYNSLFTNRFQEKSSTHAARSVLVIPALLVCVAMGCGRESPAEKVDKPTDRAAEAVERAILTPMEKAKAVEGIVQGAADRTADQTQKAGE